MSYIKNIFVTLSECLAVDWLLIAVFCILAIHLAYALLVKRLLIKIGVRSEHVIPLLDSIWQLCFKSFSIFIIYDQLRGDWNIMHWRARLDDELTKCKVHEESTPPGFMAVYVPHITFLMGDFIYVMTTRGFKNLEFLQKQAISTIFFLTSYSGCGMFGVSFIFVADWPDVFEMGSKVMYIISKHTNSNILLNGSKVLMACALYWWMITYCYIFPTFLTNNKSMASSMMKADLNMLIILDALTWTYILVTIVTSTFSRMIISYTLKSSDRPHTVEYYLFGCDPWLLKKTTSNS